MSSCRATNANITNGYRNRDWYRKHVWYGTGDPIQAALRQSRAAAERARQVREEIRELVARIHYDAIEKARARTHQAASRRRRSDRSQGRGDRAVLARPRRRADPS